MAQATLVSMKPGQSGVISGIHGGRGLRCKLLALGMRPGVRMTKVGSVFGRGPVTVDLGGFQVALGYGHAVRIVVEVEVEDR